MMAELVNRIPSADRALETVGLQRSVDVAQRLRTRLVAAFAVGVAIGLGIALLLPAAGSSLEEGAEAETPAP
jgi:hypothetical protein